MVQMPDQEQYQEWQ